MRRLACLIVLACLAQGCGIKGPLYIETPEQKRKAEERRERREAAKLRDQQQGAAPTARRGAETLPPAAAASTADTDAERNAAPELTVTDESFGPSAPPQ